MVSLRAMTDDEYRAYQRRSFEEYVEERARSLRTPVEEERGVARRPACRRGRVEDEPVAICRLKRVAADNKGRDVIVLDMRGITPLYDFFVLSTGTSRRQIHTITEETDAILRERCDEWHSNAGRMLKDV